MNRNDWRRQHTQPSTVPSLLSFNMSSTRATARSESTRVHGIMVLEVTHPTAVPLKLLRFHENTSP